MAKNLKKFSYEVPIKCIIRAGVTCDFCARRNITAFHADDGGDRDICKKCVIIFHKNINNKKNIKKK